MTHGFPGWGLINDRNFKVDLAQIIQQVHPQVILGMWSWDNAFALAHPVAYRNLLTEAIDVMLAPGNGVDGIAFLQFPVVGPLDSIIDPGLRQQQLESQNSGTDNWTRMVTSLAAQYPGRVTVLPMAASLEVNGQFSPGCRPRTVVGSGPARRTTPTFARPGRPSWGRR